MKQKFWNWMLMAMVACSFSLSTVACSDDDDDDKNGQEQRSDIDPLDTDEARTAFRWLCALADGQGFDSRWQSKTWEPTIGQPSENSQYTRIVVVEDLAEAKSHFSDLADVEASQIGQQLTVNGGAAGTMKWAVSAEGAQNLAVVEVSSRIMPHLQKLVYCTQAQTGKNASMRGTAHYRFGDVIVDQDGYYWVCVRPSFATKKDDSHWINVYNASGRGNAPGVDQLQAKRAMHEEYIYDEYNEVEKYKMKTILLPTKLPYERQHIYNLNNLLWAMINPAKYAEMAQNNKNIGLGGFALDLNGERFITSVSKFWNQVPDGYRHTVWEMVLGLTKEEVQNLEEMDFFYQGYRWWWGETPDFWIYKSKGYQNSKTGSESGDKVTNINVVTNGFDIRRYAGDPEANRNAGYEEHFVWNSNGTVRKGTWVVRYKSGEQLCTNGGRYDPYNKIPGCEDVYTFNKKTGYKVGSEVAQQKDNDIANPEGIYAVPEVGYVLAENGKFYKNETDAHEAGTDAVAMVVCVNNAQPVEAGTDYYGLAMALEDMYAGDPYPWGNGQSLDKTCPGPDGMVNPEQREQLANVLNGLSVTTRMATHGCNANHSHAIFEEVYNKAHAVTDDQQSKFSRWFIPSTGQFILACKNMGYSWNGTAFFGNGQWKWQAAGGYDQLSAIQGAHMTCTTSTGDAPSFFTFTENSIDLTPMTREVAVRPMLAFKKLQ